MKSFCWKEVYNAKIIKLSSNNASFTPRTLLLEKRLLWFFIYCIVWSKVIDVEFPRVFCEVFENMRLYVMTPKTSSLGKLMFHLPHI